MAEAPDRKPLIWMGRSRKDIGGFSDRVKGELGYGLDLAQAGEKHDNAKPLKEFIGAGVLELVEDFDGDTYRAVYTVMFTEAVYVLHVFQKALCIRLWRGFALRAVGEDVSLDGSLVLSVAPSRNQNPGLPLQKKISISSKVG